MPIPQADIANRLNRPLCCGGREEIREYFHYGAVKIFDCHFDCSIYAGEFLCSSVPKRDEKRRCLFSSDGFHLDHSVSFFCPDSDQDGKFQVSLLLCGTARNPVWTFALFPDACA